MREKIHIVLVSDVRYLPGYDVTAATLTSSCSDTDRLVWHVFDETKLKDLSGIQNLPKWNGSLMPYLRLWLPKILSNVDRVVYSDVDTVWNRDVCELWDKSSREVSISWVRDLACTHRKSDPWYEKVSKAEGRAFDWTRYACSGVCVLNLKKLRENNFTEKVLDLFEKHGVPDYPDQDVLNYLLNQDSELLPSVWNAMGDCSNLPQAGEPCVYHLTGIGRHFHDEKPLTYPPQYRFWWMVKEELSNRKVELGIGYRVLGLLWPFRWAARILPLAMRERVVRQWFFVRVAQMRKDRLSHVLRQ